VILPISLSSCHPVILSSGYPVIWSSALSPVIQLNRQRKVYREHHRMSPFAAFCRRALLPFGSRTLLLLLLCLLSACGPSNAEAGEGPVTIRTPHPTFTPTPLDQAPPPPTATSAPADSANTSAPAAQPTEAASPASSGTVKLTVNTDLVNLRDAPGTDSTVITILQKGQEFDVLGKNAAGDWWFVCCLEDKAGWVVGEFADVQGPVDQVPVVDANAALPTSQPIAAAPTPAPPTPAPPTATPVTNAEAPPAEAPPTDTPVAQGGPVPTADSFTFDLEAQEQFPEPNVVRIFLYVYQDRTALEGYTLRVAKDGAELSVGQVSFGPNSAYTWPVADPRQRAQNFKVEFPGQNPAGVWEVQLVRDGTPVGAPASFTLVANDTNRELYVRYKQR
jgi:uncharacterized protein YraI